MTDCDLLEYCNTDREREVVRAYREHGTAQRAAEALGVSRGSVTKTMSRVKGRAADVDAGKSPMPDDTVDAVEARIPAGGTLKGTSIYTQLPNGDRAWVKSDASKLTPMQIAEELRRAVEGFTPLPLDKVPPPPAPNDQLMVVLPIGDAHLNMYAAARECGADFNLEIAERNLVKAAQMLFHLLPEADTCLIQNLGDFLHNNDQTNATPKNRNQLDVAGRFWEGARCAIRVQVTLIRMALQRFRQVVIRNNPGNHDADVAHLLSMAMEGWFHDEPRVEVAPSEEPFHVHVFGQVMNVTAHGDTIKGADVPGLIAAEHHELWGATTHRYCNLGHIHHEDKKEYPGMIVEHYRTLAPKDGYHAGRYSSGRSIVADVMHREHGRIMRPEVSISLVEATT